jgi:hypothetical protein
MILSFHKLTKATKIIKKSVAVCGPITRILNDNEQMRLDLADKEDTICSLREKLTDVRKKNEVWDAREGCLDTASTL